jgi:CHAT domain-containing protein
MKFLSSFCLLVTLALSSVSFASYQDTIENGKTAFKRGHFELAAQYWEQARQEIPENRPEKYIDTSVYLAAAYQKLGRLNEASRVLKYAQSLLGKINNQEHQAVRSAKLLMQLGDVYVAMRGFQDKDLDCRMKKVSQYNSIGTKEQILNKAQDYLNQAQGVLTLVDSKKNRYPMVWANLLSKKGNILLHEAVRKTALDENYDYESHWNKVLDYYDEILKLEILKLLSPSDEDEYANLRAKTSVNLIQGAAQLDEFDKIREELETWKKLKTLEEQKTSGKTEELKKSLVLQQVEQLPPHDRSVAFIDLAQSMRTAFKHSSLVDDEEKRQLYPNAYEYAYEALIKARKIALNQQNNQVIGYANLYLAQIYAEQPRYYKIAKQLTEDALHYVQRTSVFSKKNKQTAISRGDSLVSNRFRVYLPSLLDSLPKEKCRKFCEGFSSLSVQTRSFNKFFSKHCKGNCQELPPLFLQNYHPELLVRLERQLGQLLKKQGQREKAIKAYQRAIKQVQFHQEYRSLSPSIREMKENVYLELADLFLQQVDPARTTTEKNQALLKKAIDNIEAFKKAEVQNYFQDECITELQEKELQEKVKVDQFLFENPNIAIFYPILFEDRIELLLFSNKGITREVYPRTKINEEEETIETSIEELKTKLSVVGGCGGEYPAKIYGWFKLILEKVSKQIDTLIIVPNGEFYAIPFAALYDKNAQQFLIEKYALIVTPGIKLADLRKPVQQRHEHVLLNGLSVSADGFTKLCNVPSEIMKLSCLLGGNTKVFDNQADSDAFENCLVNRKTACENDETGGQVKANTDLLQCLKDKGIECPLEGIDILQDNLPNQEFKVSSVEEQFTEQIPYSIVHFATHGEFNKKSSQTYLQTYHGKITMENLRDFIQTNKYFGKRPGDLLTLSACQTAQGGHASALGLVSVARGVRVPSVLATYWNVDDEDTVQLMTDFYRRYLHSSLSKAKALQKAQVQLLKSSTDCGSKGERQYKSPHYWAPYLLIGNGL